MDAYKIVYRKPFVYMCKENVYVDPHPEVSISPPQTFSMLSKFTKVSPKEFLSHLSSEMRVRECSRVLGLRFSPHLKSLCDIPLVVVSTLVSPGRFLGGYSGYLLRYTVLVPGWISL